MYLFLKAAQTELIGWVDTQLKKWNFPKITTFLKARSMAFVLVGNEGYLISKHWKRWNSHSDIFYPYHLPWFWIPTWRLESKENCIAALVCKKLLVTGNSPGRTDLQLLTYSWHTSVRQRGFHFQFKNTPQGRGRSTRDLILSYWEMAMQMMLMATPRKSVPRKEKLNLKISSIALFLACYVLHIPPFSNHVQSY